jgi:hypothetical protein
MSVNLHINSPGPRAFSPQQRSGLAPDGAVGQVGVYDAVATSLPQGSWSATRA